ncbi:hypothetical protein [Amycolatopsis sp. NPDC051128]|uniref:hypothetical protein n=1 Tax=Amycolatopsis sp. NPDC051128 TaxID=3155412 RepID=UPI003416DA31
MTYDLRRLRFKGLIHRIEHTHTYVLTPEGQRVATSAAAFTPAVRGRFAARGAARKGIRPSAVWWTLE